MASIRDGAIPAEIFEPLELLIFGAIGLTSFALADASASDLTLSQWRALVVIGRRSDRVRVGEIAARVGMSLPSTSRLVTRLERRGYVVTERDESDRRATLVRLTPAGRRVREAVIARRRELFAAAVEAQGRDLPNDLPRGLAALAAALDRYE